MPVERKCDNKGCYYQWGKSGKKYRYKSGDKKSREKAKTDAEIQGKAIFVSGYKKK